MLRPEPPQFDTVTTDDFESGGVALLRRQEAGREDDRVHRMQDPIGSDDAFRADALDRLGDQTDVLAIERRQIVVRDRRPLAAETIARQESLRDGVIVNL